MFKIHTKDGSTARVDLKDEAQAKLWLERFNSPEFQKSITGITIMSHCGGRYKCPVCNRATKLVCKTCGEPSHEITCNKGIQYSLSRPIGYGETHYEAEFVEPNVEARLRGGEKVTCYVGDTRVTMMIHSKQSASRVTLLKTGKRRYNPNA